MNAAQLSQDLPEDALWLNAPAATLMHLQGRPLVVAFINAASAWCCQRLIELQQWQARNPGRLQLVVVQVPRFDFERDPAREAAAEVRGEKLTCICPITRSKLRSSGKTDIVSAQTTSHATRAPSASALRKASAE